MLWLAFWHTQEKGCACMGVAHDSLLFPENLKCGMVLINSSRFDKVLVKAK